jgi:CheY-like chemotaxis protein
MSHRRRPSRVARAGASAALAAVAAAAAAAWTADLSPVGFAAGVAAAGLAGAAPYLAVRRRRGRAAARGGPPADVPAASVPPSPPAPARPALAVVAGREGAAVRVLIAEDNAVNQLIARVMLERVGCAVEVVGDGDAAIAAALARPYDVILMDVSMPGRSGLDATRAIRRAEARLNRRTPIVAMTAHAMREHRERCAEAGMDDHLAKPFRPEDLAATVARWAGRPVGPARSLAAG